jgi:hypothetical protein
MMMTIPDEFMQQIRAASKTYWRMILRQGLQWEQLDRDKIIWEHGRRNFQLRADGVLSIVCPVTDGHNLKGIGIFNATADETNRIINHDPRVKHGVFTHEVYPCRDFPGDALAR